MTTLKVYNSDDQAENQLICTLAEGDHEIGRGAKLKCTDKRVSRSHLLISVTSTGASMKSIHVNPSFYRPNGGQTRTLRFDMTASLNDDDQFGLLADSFWFKVRLLRVPPDEPNNNAEGIDAGSGSTKRKLEGESSSETKRQRSEALDSTVENPDNSDERLDGSYFTNVTLPLGKDEGTKNDEGLPDVDTVTANPDVEAFPDGGALRLPDVEAFQDGGALRLPGVEAFPDGGALRLPDVEAEGKVPDGALSDDAKADGDEEAEKKVKLEPENDLSGGTGTDTAATATTTRTVKRDRCWYGASCYRRNPIHFQQFSHRGDNDYASDPEDDRSLCPYGAGCYDRTNDHRRRYKHDGPPAPRPTTSANPPTKDDESDEDEPSTPQKKKKTKRKAAQKKKKYTETPEDDYDHDDPFLNDDSSDDFEASDDESDDESDDDWDDSQEPEEEDSQVTRTLVKEAKRFMK